MCSNFVDPWAGRHGDEKKKSVPLRTGSTGSTGSIHHLTVGTPWIIYSTTTSRWFHIYWTPQVQDIIINILVLSENNWICHDIPPIPYGLSDCFANDCVAVHIHIIILYGYTIIWHHCNHYLHYQMVILETRRNRWAAKLHLRDSGLEGELRL